METEETGLCTSPFFPSPSILLLLLLLSLSPIFRPPNLSARLLQYYCAQEDEHAFLPSRFASGKPGNPHQNIKVEK